MSDFTSKIQQLKTKVAQVNTLKENINTLLGVQASNPLTQTKAAAQTQSTAITEIKQKLGLTADATLQEVVQNVGKGGSTDFYKCVGFDFGTCVESQTDIQLVGAFSGSDPMMGSSVAYPQFAGIYNIVDSSKTGTQRQWKMTKNGTNYFIYWLSGSDTGQQGWFVGTDTAATGNLICGDTTDPTGTWSDPYMYVSVSGFSRKAIINTPPANKTWSGYKQVVRQGITFYDTSTLYTDLTYGDQYPIPGKVYNADCTMQQSYVPSTAPMSFYARQAGTVVVTTRGGKALRDTLKYRIGTSGDWLLPTKDEVIDVAQGQIIQFWNESTLCNLEYPDTSGDYDYNYNFDLKFASGAFQGGGNAMSMVNWADTGCFNSLLGGANAWDVRYLVSAPEFPMQKLQKGCYNDLFANNQQLVIPPQFPPIISAASNCFNRAFAACNALTYLPQITCTSASLCSLLSSNGMVGGSNLPYLKFMNFVATEWGGSLYMQGCNVNFGVFFKASILPAEVHSLSSSATNHKIPAKWLIVDQF